MNRTVRFLVTFVIAILISGPLIAGEHNYVPYPVIFVHGFNADFASWDTTKSNLKYLYLDKYGYHNNPQNPNDPPYFPLMNYGAAKAGPFSKNGDCTFIAVKDIDGLAPVINNAIGSAFYEPGQAHVPGKELVPPEEMKVILVCHSFGGLVTRSLLKKNENSLTFTDATGTHTVDPGYFQSHIAKVIFVGVPHQGSPLASALWILTEVNLQLDTLIDKYENSSTYISIPFIGNITLNGINQQMLHQLKVFKQDVQATINKADSLWNILDIDPYGKTIEQCRLNKSVYFKKVFYANGIVETLEKYHTGPETFLGSNNLGVPSKFSTLYAETGNPSRAGMFMTFWFKLKDFEKYISFPPGEDFSAIGSKGDVVVSSESQRLAGATHQYFLPGVAHFGGLTPGECDQYSTIREALCEDAPLMNLQEPSPIGMIYSRQLKGKIRDYLPLDCAGIGKLERLSPNPGWQWQDVYVATELNPNYEESKDNYQAIFKPGQLLPLDSSDFNQQFKLTLSPVNAGGISGAQQSLTFTYTNFIYGTVPGDKSQEVTLDASIVIYCRENARSETVNASNISITPATPGTFTVQGKIITFTPAAPLQDNTQYTVTIKGDDPATYNVEYPTSTIADKHGWEPESVYLELQKTSREFA